MNPTGLRHGGLRTVRGAAGDSRPKQPVRMEQLGTYMTIQNSAALFASVIESAMDAIVSIDSGQHIVLFNTAAEKMFRYAAADLLGQPIGRLIPERFHAAHAMHIEAFAKTAVTSRSVHSLGEQFGLRSDGVEFPIEASISQTRTNGQHLFTVILRDITQRRRIEKSLIESEARFHRIFDNMLEGCQIIGFDWHYLYVNESIARHSRVTREQLLGRTMMEVFPGLEHTDIFAVLDRCMRERTSVRQETRFDYPDAAHAWFQVSVQPAPEGIFILSIDITERKRVETALRENDERFRQIAESLPQLIWTAGADGVCDFLSRQWEQYAGASTDLLAGLGWMECVHPDDRTRLLAEWDAAVRSATEFRAEFRLKRYDDTYRWFDTRATPLRDAQGHVVKWFGSNIDIDDHRRTQELQLRTQKMEALGTLAGGIAHDFNNILLAIRGNTRLAIADMQNDHPALESLHEIDRASTRASDLVRRILSFSRQEEPQQQVIQLQPVIEEALKLLRSTLPAMIELRSRFAPSMPAIKADSSQLHQVVMNLATNAAHAIGSHTGIIEMNLDELHIDAWLARTMPGLHEGQYVRLSVNDNGCGIDKGTVERIFDPFFTTKPVGQGTGLGLSVVDGIMKSHGGAITVHSQPGQGTVFRLYFPATQDCVVHTPMRSEPIATAQGQRVLYVDDDDALVFLAVRTLSRLGYEVTGCADPREALEKFRLHPHAYDALVTDLSMPAMSGNELARDILAIRADLPVIITSGYLRPEDQETAQRLGAIALILKPNTVEELGQTLDRLFRRPQP